MVTSSARLSYDRRLPGGWRYAVPDALLTTGRVHRLLDQAAGSGALAGGLIACCPGEVPGAGYDPPAAELADRIRLAWAGHP